MTRKLEQLAADTKSAIMQENVPQLFTILNSLDEKEIDVFHYDMDSPVIDLITRTGEISVVSQLYPGIAMAIRRSIIAGKTDAKQITGLSSYMLDLLSLIYISLINERCYRYYMAERNFILKNAKIHSFWRWYLAHLPADLKLESIGEYDYPTQFVFCLLYTSEAETVEL